MSFGNVDGVHLDAVRADDEFQAQRKKKRKTRNKSALIWIGAALVAIIAIVFLMVFIWSMA